MLAETRREVHYCLVGNQRVNERYEDCLYKRLPNTCNWILDRPAFTSWISPDFPAATAKLLWTYGQAGFGKTVLCAHLINHLSSTLPPLSPTSSSRPMTRMRLCAAGSLSWRHIQTRSRSSTGDGRPRRTVFRHGGASFNSCARSIEAWGCVSRY